MTIMIHTARRWSLFLSHQYILIVLRIYLLQQAFLKDTNVAPPKKYKCRITPSPPHNGYLAVQTSFFSPQGGGCTEVRLYV